ncbi:MAG: ABC transporter substrate-binding protein [Acidimicrobiia bacterium]|nr:ABC transporter substrate-binding protein [Acidimicrobiia bacterium]
MVRRFHPLLILLLVLALVAVACGDDDDDGDGAAPATTAAADGDGDGAAECDDSDPVKAGASLSISGPAADIGALAQDGAEMAIEDINAEGGILGRCVELVLRDDTGDPTRAAQVMRELVDQEEVDFVVGPFLSSPIGAAIEVTAPANVLHVVAGVLPTAGDAATFPHVFRSEVVATLQGQTFAEYMKASGWTSAAIIAVNNALGTSVVDAFTPVAEAEGLEITATEFHESGAVDQTTQLRNLMGTDPDVLLVFNTAGPDTVATISGRNSLNWDVPALGFSSIANTSITDAFEPGEMDLVYGGQAYRLLNREPGSDEPIGEAAAAFKDRYKEFLGADPLEVNIQQASGIYDSYRMMALAINEVGEIDPDGVKDYLESNGYDGVKATYEYDAERHDGIGLDDLVFIVADSFEDGTLELAPNQ